MEWWKCYGTSDLMGGGGDEGSKIVQMNHGQRMRRGAAMDGRGV